MLEAYLALEYARGIHSKEYSTDFLWSKIYGPSIFEDTMSRYIKKLESFCNSISRANTLVAFRMTGSPISKTFLTDLR